MPMTQIKTVANQQRLIRKLLTSSVLSRVIAVNLWLVSLTRSALAEYQMMIDTADK
jgi:hypothetical protein